MGTNASNQQGIVWILSGKIRYLIYIWISKDTIYVVSVIGKGLQTNPIEQLLQGDAIKEEVQLRGYGHGIKEYIISSRGRLLHWCDIYFIYWRNM